MKFTDFIDMVQSRGFAVFPCVPNGKRPLTKHGWHDASSKAERIEEWRKEFPSCNWGLRTGSGLVALDVDLKNGLDGFSVLRELEGAHDPLPATLTNMTPNGGQHLLFTAPPGIANSASKLGLGLDVRGEGGHIVIPPSVLSDVPYIWSDANAPIAQSPLWLNKLFATKAPRVYEGSRNDWLTKEAGRLRQRNVEYNAALDKLMALNTERCSPQLDESEVRQVLASVWRYEPGYHFTDVGNAQRFCDRVGRDIRFSVDQRKFLHFDGLSWQLDHDGVVMRLMKDDMRRQLLLAYDEQDGARRKQAVSWARSSENLPRICSALKVVETEPDIPVRQIELDSDPLLFATRNAVIDLRTQKPVEAVREQLITKRGGCDYDPATASPTFQAFLERVLPSPQVRRFLQCAVGYSLTGLTSEQCLFLLIGTGANGKTVLTNVLLQLLGDYGCKTRAATWLLKRGDGGPQNDLAALAGRRLVLTTELNDGARLDQSLVKSATGGEPLTARFLFQEFFTFGQQFKLFLATNHKPQIDGGDPAMARRLRLIPFTVTIPEGERDQQLSEKLRAELPGILNWAIEGCAQWLKGGLGLPDDVRHATDTYVGEQDRIAQWLGDCCEKGEDLAEVGSVLYANYREWANQYGVHALSNQRFAQVLEERGFARRRTTKKRLVLGLRLSPVGDHGDNFEQM